MTKKMDVWLVLRLIVDGDVNVNDEKKLLVNICFTEKKCGMYH